jgi:hypothetical protein
MTLIKQAVNWMDWFQVAWDRTCGACLMTQQTSGLVLIVVISVLYIVVISIDDKLFKLMFDDNFHICMICGIEIKSVNQYPDLYDS